jgi:hypothetical protein
MGSNPPPAILSSFKTLRLQMNFWIVILAKTKRMKRVKPPQVNMPLSLADIILYALFLFDV